jgi:hypothetical protein
MDWPERMHVSKSKDIRSWEGPPRRSGPSSVYEVLDNLNVG